jgi:uncharacterized membrane protein HdeD (DUF308 family)
MQRRSLPQPEKFTLKDALQILLGVLMIPLGALIFVRTWQLGAILPAILIGGAFLCFGVYRTLFAWGRLKWYTRLRGAGKHG